MSMDTRKWAKLPARLSLAVAAAMLAPALVQANTEDTEKQSQQASSWEEKATETSSQVGSEEMSTESSGALAALAEQEGDISEFVKALEKSGLAEGLTSGTQYTIFAPTNEALQADSNLQTLMESDDPADQEELVNLLRGHIVADDVDSEMAKTIGKAKTVGGNEVELTSEGEKLMVGEAEVVTPDIQQDNLRVFAIDGVLEPGTASIASTETGEDAGTSSSERGAMASADFDELDQDSDGYLSEEEMQSAQDLAGETDQLDSDQDGRLSRTEFAAFEAESMVPSDSDPRSSTDDPSTDESAESQSQWDE